VFLGLSVWLVRKVLKAARTERDLEEQRFEGAFADELRAAKARAAAAAQRPNLAAVTESGRDAPEPDPLARADARGARPDHLAVVGKLVRAREEAVEVLWIRSSATHAVWCERAGTTDVVRVARIERGAVVEQWSFA